MLLKWLLLDNLIKPQDTTATRYHDRTLRIDYPSNICEIRRLKIQKLN